MDIKYCQHGIVPVSVAECAGLQAGEAVVFLLTVWLRVRTQVTLVGRVDMEYLPGVRVPGVVPGSVAERAGLRAGDVIAAVNGLPVDASPGVVQQLVNRIRDSGGRSLVLSLQRAPGMLPAGRAGAAAAAVPDARQELPTAPALVDVVRAGADC